MEEEANVEFAEVCAGMDAWLGWILTVIYLDEDGKQVSRMCKSAEWFLLDTGDFPQQTGYNSFV